MIFNKINLAKTYHEVQKSKGHEYKTALKTHFRLFEYCFLLFGLCNTSAKLQGSSIRYFEPIWISFAPCI